MNTVHGHPAGPQRATARLTLPSTGWPGFAVRVAGVALVAPLVAWLHHRYNLGVLCPLRRMTGVPCPLCGSTTVFVELGSGSLRGAVLANPVTLTAALGLLLAPLGPGRWWWRRSYRFRQALVLGALAVAWLWELQRFGILPHLAPGA